MMDALECEGLFHLDLQDSEVGRAFLTQAEGLLAVAKEAFQLPLQEKERCKLIPRLGPSGYKPMGTSKATDITQKPDSTECFKVAKDQLIANVWPPAQPFPEVIIEEKQLFKDFATNSHECSMLVLRVIAKQLNLKTDSFTDLHLIDRPSMSHISLTHKPGVTPNPNTIGLVSHTDFGSVTIIFNWLGGLQVKPLDSLVSDSYLYVRPVPGHCIVNLGDAMEVFTNGALKAIKHRVVPMPGAQSAHDRYSVCYFGKPHNDVLMKPLDELVRASKVHARNDSPLHDSDDRAEQVSNIKVGGKFSAGDGDDKIYTAGEWSAMRGTSIMSLGHL